MAEVMNEFNSSNGEVDDEIDEVKRNGDACDGASSISAKPPSQQKDAQFHDSISSNDKLSSPSTKNPDVINDTVDTDHAETREQNSVKTGSSPIVINVANGRLKPDAASVEHDENSRENNKHDDSQSPSASITITKKSVLDAADKSVTNECNSSSSNDCIIDGDASDSNCDSNKAESGKKSNPTTDNETSSTAKGNAGGTNAIDENGAATDLSKRSSDASADKNGDDEDDEANEDDEVISISSTPDRSKKSSKKPSMSIVNITPRRSSRNLNKQQKSYVEKDADFEGSGSDGVAIISSRKRPHSSSGTGEDDEIQEITPIDPLAEEPSRSSTGRMRGNKTIVVSDTKGLVEFASNTKASRSNKKEPTLVIIDTNSILSGRGPIPVTQQSGSSSLHHSSSSSAPIPVSLPIPAGAFARGSTPSSSAFSVIPIGLPAQGMYSQFKNPPPQMKPIVVGPASTSVTPVPTAQSTAASTLSATTITTVASAQPTNKQPPVVLPSLTDDMFVVEAPSFIVPYVYEKPPMKSLKDHIEKIESDIKKQAAEEAQRKQERAEESKDSASDKTARSDNEEKSASSDAAAVSSSKDKADVASKEDPTKDDSKKPDQDGESATKDEISKDQDKSEAEKKDTSKEGDSTERMEVDKEPETASKPAAALVEPDTAKKMEVDTSPVNAVKEIEKKITAGPTTGTDDPKKPASYFDNPLGKFFMQIGLNLVQEHVQTDLLRSQKRKRDKEGAKCSEEVHSVIDELTKTLESSKENNDPFKLELKKCELCSFKTESMLVMAHHLETPHMKNYTYRCNFCSIEVRSPHDILFHMEAEHNIRGRLERTPSFHQCPNCPFEDNQKGKLTRHLISCAKKYRPERNQEPPLDWEPPAKIPRVTRNRPPSMNSNNAVYQAAMSGLKQVPQNTLLPKLIPNATNMKHNMLNVANKRPNLANSFVNRFPNAGNAQPNFQQRPHSMQTPNQGMMFRAGGQNSQTPVLLPQGYHLSGAQIYQAQNNKSQSTQQSIAAAKLLNQPSISITPLPRQTSASNNTSSSNAKSGVGKSINSVAAAAKGGGNFVVCEICDGYIKDLEQLRNHMQWIHKVKIHPKMIYNRPPLNCQKCQERFFTDQGLERHLLGAHGLVTSSMQEAANKGKDGGRCPVCGRVYQWKLLNHVARDHQMALKPAHLSYKCTVCTATFGMYKQFENHVYSAHSVVAKRAMDTSKKPPSASSSSQNDALLKPLKINDEITIIPQPVRSTRPSNRESNAATITKTVSGSRKMDDNDNSINIDDTDDQSVDDGLCKCTCLTGNFADYEAFRRHVTEKHLKSFKIVLSRLDLNSLNRVPNKENAFKLTKFDRSLISNQIREKYKLSDFFIEVKRQRLRSDFKYKVVENRGRVEPAQTADIGHVVPEAVYSNVELQDDDETKKQNKVLLSKTLYVQRKVGKHLNACRSQPRAQKIDPAPASVRPAAAAVLNAGKRKNLTVPVPNSTTTAAVFNGGKQKRLISRSRRNAARQNTRKHTKDSADWSSDDETVTEERRRAPTPNSDQFNQHFMSELASFSSSSANRRDPSSIFSAASCSMTSRHIVKASRQTANAAKNQSSRYQPYASKRSPGGPLSVFNQRTVTMSTSSATFATVAPKPSGLAGSNPLNVLNSVQLCKQRSIKVTKQITTYRSGVTTQQPQPYVRPTPPQNVASKPQAVISLLSDSESDQNTVEIVDSPAVANSDDNEVYILPT